MNKVDWLEGAWAGLQPGARGVRARQHRGAGRAAARHRPRDDRRCPPELHIHRKLKRIIGQRRESIEAGEGIDWATAEHLAFGSLLREGLPVRLCGQDSGRGTFSQRHAVLYDQETEERYVPLNHLDPEQAPFEVVDSFLSEEGVLGFEYGYSLADPNSLVLWEAQFGDFANGAQVYFDQFIASGEAKWLRMSGLVCLLPHGYEGQGPEHSSARLERFLQLYADDNIQVLYPSTPANYFHALRRQLHRAVPQAADRDDAQVAAAPQAVHLEPRGDGRGQQLPPGDVRAAALAADRDVTRVVLCSGKVYYDLLQRRQELGLEEASALLRLEQLAPFPGAVLAEELVRFPKRAEVVWCQEEPQNMGAWTFVAPRIEAVLEETRHAAEPAGLRRPAGRGLAGDRALSAARARADQPGRGGADRRPAGSGRDRLRPTWRPRATRTSGIGEG